MKKDGTQKINLKKLTIARISADAMKKIEGGSSTTTDPTNVVDLGHELWNICALGIK
ncbi:class I lanthipeptide [uncultured Aquimarina sp.]|uniref:class I lanthipeptide n=1 Tax=uncultured Aquimarina sp. TaxID=575652 RepID=UPI00260E8BEE|nr:class I lanthipeptide [uncultured Aquimarina sp.]